ncbi:4Fe-4S dicluster domain-containing protein [Edwardsiella tarda]|uniref:4Fe-4S dicluster domain-containing protein n=1 Tax=Edwardsiella tarda TaxID=636 RepID=UPI00030AB692|nr:4Fe-4S dicluster domain-containing protein [Edwardsiella tarda]
MKHYSRRSIIIGAGFIVLAPGILLSAPTRKGKQYALIHDQAKCVGCKECVNACNQINQVAPGCARLAIVPLPSATSQSEDKPRYFRHSCQHCDPAPCLDVCPSGATYRDQHGLIQIDAQRCLGCGYCISACPYQARYLHPTRHIADKCDFCSATRLSHGQVPICVRICPYHALSFGELDTPSFELKLALAPYYQYHLAGTRHSRIYRILADD